MVILPSKADESPPNPAVIFSPKELKSRKEVSCTHGVFTIHYRLHLYGYFPGVLNCSDLSAVVLFETLKCSAPVCSLVVDSSGQGQNFALTPLRVAL